ncbi:MAG: lysine--tRNA ligase [Myxococcota bacterium]
MATEDELIEARRAKARGLAETGTQPWPNDFRVDAAKERRRREFVRLSQDEAARARLPDEDGAKQGEDHVLYGRVMAKRGPFLVLRTPYGDAQALVRPENLPAADAAQLAQLDLADHVAVSGPAMKTRTGAAALLATRHQHVSKALLPPPAKWHGLKDVEKRYRERYVDLFANPEVARVFRARGLIVHRLRRYLDEHGFLEVETPLLHGVRGGATARPFATHHNALDLDLYLRVAPELYLKRLLVGGLDRVYELGRTFRNEGISTRHNPEFTILEFYTAYATYEDLMDLTEPMVRAVDAALTEAFPHLTAERPFELHDDWPRVSMRRAILDRVQRSGRDGVPETAWAGVLDERTLEDADALADACARMRDRIDTEDRKALEKCTSYGERVFTLFEILAEPALPALYRTEDGAQSLPVFITEFPVEVSPLARRNDADPRWVDRFELFVEGREVANAFSELNDPDDQAERFRAQLAARERGDEEAMDYDVDYVRALLHGMPPAAGFGLGVDRFTMLLCGQPSIRDVLLFPLLRPEAG